MSCNLSHTAKGLLPVGLVLAVVACSTVDRGFSFNSFWGRQVPEMKSLSHSEFHEKVVGRAWSSIAIREVLPDGTYDGKEYVRLGAQVAASEVFFVTDSTATLYMRPTEGNGRPGMHIDVRYTYDEKGNKVIVDYGRAKHTSVILFVEGDDMLIQATSGHRADGSDVILLEHNRAISYKELAHIRKDCQLNWDNLEVSKD